MGHTETFVDGIWHPSVTTVMGAEPKPWLQAWYEKWGLLAYRKTRLASAIGTEFHRCVESWLDTGTYTVTAPAVWVSDTAGYTATSCIPRIEGMMRSFVGWAMSIDGEVHRTELTVVSRVHTYSGTLDAVGTLDGKPIIFDWKTSSRIYPEMALQLSAYAEAYREETGHAVGRGIIVHVSKDKPHHKVTTKMFKLGKRVFKKFLRLRAMFDKVQEKTNV